MSEIMVTIHIEPLDEGGYLATSTELQGLIAQGRTIAETMEIAQDVARKLIESRVAHGDPLSLMFHAAFREDTHELTAAIPVAVPEVFMR